MPLLKADVDVRLPSCCNVVTPKQAACLVTGLLYGQMTYPSFPVMDKLFRLNYTSKKGQMFSDFLFLTSSGICMSNSQLWTVCVFCKAKAADGV